jgi:hypothetical protein
LRTADDDRDPSIDSLALLPWLGVDAGAATREMRELAVLECDAIAGLYRF